MARFRIPILCLMALMCSTLVGALMLCAAASTAPSSLVFVPDEHVASDTTTWATQCAWIRDHAASWHIEGVMSGGDFNGVRVWPDAWTYGWSVIDGMGVPYITAVGNHDYYMESPSTRNTVIFDQQLGQERVAAKSWYGGFWNDGGSSKANYYIKFTTTNGHRFVVIALELFPRPGAIAWATGIINAHSGEEIIVISHGILNPGIPAFSLVAGTPIQQGDSWGPTYYTLPTDNYSGQALIDWAKQYPQVRLLICGHNDPPAFTYRTDGHLYTVMSDYQDTGAPASQSILILEFANARVDIYNVNTTTNTIDDTTYPKVRLNWNAPAGSGVRGKGAMVGGGWR